MRWGTRHARDPVFVERVVVFLFESLRGRGRCRDYGFRHLPVVTGAIIAGDARLLRREGVAGFRQLPLKSERRKKVFKERLSTRDWKFRFTNLFSKYSLMLIS